MKYGRFLSNPASSVGDSVRRHQQNIINQLAVDIQREWLRGISSNEIKTILQKAGYSDSQIQKAVTLANESLNKRSGLSKNPLEYWILDTEKKGKSQNYLTVKRGGREAAERIADDLNRKVGRERFRVMGFGTENPATNRKLIIEFIKYSLRGTDFDYTYWPKDEINEFNKKYPTPPLLMYHDWHKVKIIPTSKNFTGEFIQGQNKVKIVRTKDPISFLTEYNGKKYSVHW